MMQAQPAASKGLLVPSMLTPCIYAPHPLLLRPQSHLSRAALNPDMAADARAAVGRATRLLQAMVDVISSSGWLNPALAGALPPGCCCFWDPCPRCFRGTVAAGLASATLAQGQAAFICCAAETASPLSWVSFHAVPLYDCLRGVATG